MTFESNLEKYAELAVKTALNIQPGQTLWISAPIHIPQFVRLIVKNAYEAGAKNVHIEWIDEICTRLKYTLAPDDSFDKYPLWRANALEELAKENGAYLHIESSDPELLKGVDTKRISAYSIAAGTALVKWREYTSTYKMTWSIIAAPSAGWAKKVFPAMDEENAVNALWDAIFKATRADQENPVQAWTEHNATFRDKRDYLNQKQYKRLHYRAPGTELTVELPNDHLWRGGDASNAQGISFNPNVPTEEVFTSPKKDGTHGFVSSTKPLAYQGNLIENFTLKFENGRIVDYQAEKGYEGLQSMIEMDEGSHYLGEIALVPHHSPISSSNLIFFNTLFDENASNHLAVGMGFPTCIQNGTSMSKTELENAGINDSIIHVDFMIGSSHMEIDGETADGQLESIFRNGNWAF
ncbi:aminopeptidase [Paenibacillus sp. GP183]|uniref:aminopeptidase n=1 Tax=Paenibacillus sp. GP183 TaxID=1882751 RepID=UPI000894A67F|nr:aminopeptidase [Paenibacillus sp. GP183]SEC36071.1 aminopeptidase [Paenibacillus sp. GP183]